MREEAIRKTYEAVASRAPFSVDVFIAALQDWDITPVFDGEEIIGSILTKENELHIGLYRRPKASVGRFIRSAMRDTIDKYGFAITTVQPQNSAGLRFCERLGFVKVGEKGGNILLRCDRSNY